METISVGKILKSALHRRLHGKNRRGELFPTAGAPSVAAALRQVNDSNLPLDREKPAEEIESLGKSRRAELNSQIRRILRHLFKPEAAPATDPRAGWRTTSLDTRTELRDLLEDSPSLRHEIDGVISKQVPAAAKLATLDLEQHGEPCDAVWARLDKGGFAAEQVLGDWFPGAADGVAHEAHR